MTPLIVFFVISASAIGVLGFDPEKALETCAKENNVSIDAIMTDKFVQPSHDPAIKCYHACMGKKMGWMTENGNVIADKLIKPMSEIPEEHRSTAERLLQTCVKVGKNECETAYFIMRYLTAYQRKKQ